MELTLKGYLEFLEVQKFNIGNAQMNLKLINKVLEFIDKSNVKQFYPMNGFDKEPNQEFYFFTEEKIIICKRKENCVLKVIDRANILNISFEEPLGYSEDCKLVIKLKDDATITFESLKDSNDDWNAAYNKKIKEIFKELI